MIPVNSIICGAMPEATKWHNCYEGGWQGIIVPEAFSHPAKMSYSLLKRILAHAKEQGFLREGDVILDPFGGIGSTGILGAYEGYQVVCVELEDKFCKLAEQNFKLHDNAWRKLGCPRPIILQGDSRKLCEVVEKADCIVSSPPFTSVISPIEQKFYAESRRKHGRSPNCKHFGTNGYPRTPGQLGNMKPGKVDCILSSPPYAETVSSGRDGIDFAKAGRPDKMKSEGYNKHYPIGAGAECDYSYGSTKGNLGNLKSGDVDCVLGSPPFMLSDNRDADKSGFAHKFHGNQRYGDEKASLTSERGGDRLSKEREAARQKNVKSIKNLGNIVSGGNSELLNMDTFWAAAKTIVEQCFQILKPGGYAIWVVKSFVRNKKIIDFPGDWQRLCESVGFKTVCIHHAMLIKETKHKTLFGHMETKRTERKSFFRRLAESKGSPRIDYEVVLCMEKIAQPIGFI